jgi:hypothetical protein
MSELGNLETTVTGKIKRFNNGGGYYYTTVVSPAADAYSFPQLYALSPRNHLAV